MSMEPTTLPGRPAGPVATAPAHGRPVRVAFLIDRLAVAGTESQLVALIRRLDRRRVLPLLCLLDGEDELSRSLEPDCPVLRLGVRGPLARPGVALKMLRLAEFLRRHRVEVLQMYFPDSTYVGAVAGLLAGVPHRVRARNNTGHWMTTAHRRLGRLVGRLLTATVANGEASRRSIIADQGAVPGSVVVLENGVDLERFPEGRAWTPRAGRQLVGAVANLRAVKGLDVLVEAAARVVVAHPDAAFAVAGEGPERPVLERLIGELDLAGRFDLLGSMTEVPEFLSRLDVAVLSSRAEGMPNAVLEYMAAGRPIVATAVGDTPCLIEDEVHGLLVPPGDPGQLAGAIGRLLADPGLAARLGAAARRRAEERYSREAMVRRFEDFFLGLAMGPAEGDR